MSTTTTTSTSTSAGPTSPFFAAECRETARLNQKLAAREKNRAAGKKMDAEIRAIKSRIADIRRKLRAANKGGAKTPATSR